MTSPPPSREVAMNSRQKTQLLEQVLHHQQRQLAAAKKAKDEPNAKKLAKRIEHTRGLIRSLGNLD
jgi:hypothetical protein